MEDLYNYVNPLNKRHSPMVSKETLDIVLENKAVSDADLYHFIYNKHHNIMSSLCSVSTRPSFMTETFPTTSLALRSVYICTD